MVEALAAAATAVVNARGQCLACHVTPGGDFRYPVPTMEQYAMLRWLVAAPSLLLFTYGLLLYIERWLAGRGRPRIPGGLKAGLARVIRYGLLQAKVLRRGTPGGGWLVHLLIYLGGIILLAAGLLYVYDARATRFPTGSPVYPAFRVMVNLGGLLLLAGVAAAAARRLLRLTPGQPTGPGDYLVLAWLAAVALTGMILDAATAVAHNPSSVPAYDVSARLLEPLLNGMSVEGFLELFRYTQIIHLVLTAGLLAYLPFTKLSHIVVSGFFNILYARPEPAKLSIVEDAEKRIEEGGYIGVVRVGDTSWKQRMDYDACTGCARCHNACPAAISGKPLSPMKLVLTMREAVRTRSPDEPVVPAVVEPGVVWSCVTCGACVNECPVLIHHVETIVDLRRGLISQGENIPEELLQVSYNLMRTGNPYGSDPYEKEQWLQGLAEKGLVEIAREDEEYDYILWVGCAPAYDPRLRGTVEAVLRLAKRAGLRVAVIPEQGCCGDPARRIGDELMFLELAKQNIEMLQRYRFKRLLVTCPHGYNVFRHDYPRLGLKIEVEHHSQLLARLLREGKLPAPRRKLPVKATFHDPCYLGRWNKVYEPPREVVRASVEELREMPRSRERSFCCGGGGGGAFYDPKIGRRISRIRAEEAAGTGARVLAVACPFCNIMLSAEAPDLGLEVKDIAELLDEALGSEEASSKTRQGEEAG